MHATIIGANYYSTRVSLRFIYQLQAIRNACHRRESFSTDLDIRPSKLLLMLGHVRHPPKSLKSESFLCIHPAWGVDRLGECILRMTKYLMCFCGPFLFLNASYSSSRSTLPCKLSSVLPLCRKYRARGPVN
jgi:hypothetical protein